MNDQDITSAIAESFPRPFKQGDRVVFHGSTEGFRTLSEYQGKEYTVISTTGNTTYVTDGKGPGYTFKSVNLQLVKEDEPVRVVSPREAVLMTAVDAVTKERNNTYGPPTQDFERTALLASSLGFEFGGAALEAHHVAMFMILLKLSRAVWSPEERDHWVDISGYAGCGYECVVEDIHGSD